MALLEKRLGTTKFAASINEAQLHQQNSKKRGFDPHSKPGNDTETEDMINGFKRSKSNPVCTHSLLICCLFVFLIVVRIILP